LIIFSIQLKNGEVFLYVIQIRIELKVKGHQNLALTNFKLLSKINNELERQMDRLEGIKAHFRLVLAIGARLGS
jgi:hypothetical protein